ncbi:alpha/beta fold hydrolase [Halegenticoccus tardaugens]|uniref:alpha/beta fold hydrolase n=1 Tax=Halegenticoccus tardaugens TaxID=2071624 RepID=UPI00100B297C|nr:alpha/beta hydrolase [Halegenticoccus tardaugens]
MPAIPTADGDCSLHYRARGDGQPLVFVHGGWLNGEMWDAQVEHFSDRYRVVAVDLAGHGETDTAARDDYSVGAAADDLATLVAELDLDAPVLCGLSLGSLVVQAYAADRPEAVAGAILCGTMRTFPPIPITPLQQRFLFPKPSIHAAIRTFGPGAYFRGLLGGIRSVEGGRWLALDDDARAYALAQVDRFSTEEFIKVFDALYEFEPRDLSALSAPTLLLHGDREASTLVAQTGQLERSLPNASRTTVADAAHLANMDNPTGFNAALDDFLADHASR